MYNVTIDGVLIDLYWFIRVKKFFMKSKENP